MSHLFASSWWYARSLDLPIDYFIIKKKRCTNMTVFYLDTSAIVKRYRTEKGTEFIDRLFKEIEISEHRLATSFLAVLEFVSAFRKLVKAREISQEIFIDSLARFV